MPTCDPLPALGPMATSFVVTQDTVQAACLDNSLGDGLQVAQLLHLSHLLPTEGFLHQRQAGQSEPAALPTAALDPQPSLLHGVQGCS